MTSTPTKNVRLTISVTPEVHATFQRLSNASGMSISRAMGEWLGDTLDAADFMASTVERARAAPKLVIQELQAYTLGLSDELSGVMERVRQKGQDDRREKAADRGPACGERAPLLLAPTLPPSGNTGVKVQTTGQATGGKSS